MFRYLMNLSSEKQVCEKKQDRDLLLHTVTSCTQIKTLHQMCDCVMSQSLYLSWQSDFMCFHSNKTFSFLCYMHSFKVCVTVPLQSFTHDWLTHSLMSSFSFNWILLSFNNSCSFKHIVLLKIDKGAVESNNHITV